MSMMEISVNTVNDFFVIANLISVMMNHPFTWHVGPIPIDSEPSEWEICAKLRGS